MKTFVAIWCFIFCGALKGQSYSDTAGILFGKQTGIFSNFVIKKEKFGKSWYSYSRTYFMHNSLRLNNRRYLPTGFFFGRFEKYCIANQISYNKDALKKFRRRSLASGFLYILYVTSYVPIILDAAFNPVAPPCPQCFYASPNSPILLSLPFLEAIGSAKIRSHAERKLLEELFVVQNK